MSIELVRESNIFILCHPLILLSSIFPSIRDFSYEAILCIRWPKYWCFNFSISPYNEYWGLISFRMDCLNLLEVQGTLKSLFQYHSSKASILSCSAFFIVQLSHPYMTIGKTIALTRWTFLPRSKHLLILWLQLPSAVILAPPPKDSVTVSIFFPIYLSWSDRTRCHASFFECWVLS